MAHRDQQEATISMMELASGISFFAVLICIIKHHAYSFKYRMLLYLESPMHRLLASICYVILHIHSLPFTCNFLTTFIFHGIVVAASYCTKIVHCTRIPKYTIVYEISSLQTASNLD
jgi:hypothetical protein